MTTNSPAFEVFTVTDSPNEEGKGYWTRIGSCWRQKSGNGFNISLNALPVNGKLVLLPPKPKEHERDWSNTDAF